MRLGFGEILVILALALLFFGPSKLPQLGTSLGEAIRGFKKGMAGLDEEPKGEPTAEEKVAASREKVAARPPPSA